MRKIAFVIGTLVWVMAGSVFAQAPTFQFVSPNTTIVGDVTYVDLYCTLEIQNLLQSDTIRVRCVRLETNLTPGHVTNFCWGSTCYPPHVDSSLADLKIPPGQINNSFLTDLAVNNVPGTSTVTYRVYTVSPYYYADTIMLTFIVQDTSTAISGSINPESNILSVYPNPAKSYTTVRYKMSNESDLQLVLYDLLGKEKETYPLPSASGILRLDLSQYKPGVYFLTLKSGRKTMLTRRLIIVRE